MSLVDQRPPSTLRSLTTAGCGSFPDDLSLTSSDLHKRASSLSTDSGHPRSEMSISRENFHSLDLREKSLAIANLAEDLQDAIVLSQKIRLGSKEVLRQNERRLSTMLEAQDGPLNHARILAQLHSISEEIMVFVQVRQKQ